jgi:lysophospholipase L1-like esterase
LAQPSWARVLARADIVTVTIGANDFAFATFQRGHCGDLRCYAPQLAALRHNLDTTLTTIATLRRGRPTAVRLTGYWDIWRDGQVARAQGATYARVGRRLTARVNAVIASVAAAHHVPFVDLVAPFRGSDGDSDDTGLLASDGDHPNNAGHQVIAATLMLLGLAPLLSG